MSPSEDSFNPGPSGGILLSFLRAILQFVLTTSNPHATCELEHRDSNIAGTYYLYCSRTTPDGIELISVGHFVPDPVTRLRPPGKERP